MSPLQCDRHLQENRLEVQTKLGHYLLARWRLRFLCEARKYFRRNRGSAILPFAAPLAWQLTRGQSVF